MAGVLWWIRRDVRLDDNLVIQHARSSGYAIIPVFILDPHILEQAAPPHQNFLFEGLQYLDSRLTQEHRARLIVRQGKPAEELARLIHETGATKILAEEDYSPYARRRDQEVAEHARLEVVTGATIHHPSVVTHSDGRPYKVYSAFSRAWKALPFPGRSFPGEPATFVSLPGLDSLPLPTGTQSPKFPAGEAEAARRLSSFMSGPILSYASHRDRLDLDGTSGLSPYLRFGMLSPRKAAWEAQAAIESGGPEAAPGPRKWLDELIWREFNYNIVYHFPHVLKESFNRMLGAIPWRDDPLALHAWQEGLTGYPVVDACMRQLLETGWMNNRGRMITASFLSKDLLINWQEGERWFMRHLVDGDPAQNTCGWQWTAGVGMDAAPYFRIFNPVSQGMKFDPDGNFIRRWIPELRHVPVEYIHQPWLMPEGAQSTARCYIGKDYPAPLVDHREAKERALMKFRNQKP